MAVGERPHVVIVGAGFGGLAAALGLIAMTVVIETIYPDAYWEHGMWLVMFLIVLTRGPGAFALDNCVMRPLYTPA